MTNENLPAPLTFNNEEFGRLDTIIIDNAPWFIGRQVATILGYAIPHKAIADHVDNADKKLLTYDEIQRFQIGSFASPRGLTVINEFGVADLFLLSKLPEAKKFRHWFTHEVLPSIRKTGSYSLPTVPAPVDPKRLSTVIDELGLTANKLTEVFGVAKGIALSKATALVEDNYSVNLNAVRGLLPPAEDNVGLLNPTQIGELISPNPQYKRSARFVNDVLIDCGLQTRVGNCYQLTEEGQKHGEMMPYTRNGHSGYRPLWKLSAVNCVKEQLQRHNYATCIIADAVLKSDEEE